jgi:hypothetical protein
VLDRRSAAADDVDMAFKLLNGLVDANERIQAPKRRLVRNSRPVEANKCRGHGRHFIAPRPAEARDE